MKETISILLGSGFSIPEGLPSVRQLNQRLGKIDESEILIHTDQHAMFLDGQVDNNRWSRKDERFFLQEFLEFYNTDVLTHEEEFHYETFYDFYAGYLREGENRSKIEEFFNKFNNKQLNGRVYNTDCYNSVANFNRSYNQLIASQLHKSKYYEDVSTLNYPPYDSFVNFIKRMVVISDIKIHSLNHDLFFDWLGHHHVDLWQNFSDGFELAGSPFYGNVSYDFNQNSENKVHKSYKIKLSRFIDKFDKPICLYKLHGSVFNTIVYTPQPNQEIIRLRDNYAVSGFEIEIYDKEKNEYRFEHLWDEVAPDFLSGTTAKTRHYTNDPYYKNLFKYFKENLKKSELLLVIGYGFQDPGINDYLENEFLKLGKKMIVIDPNKPNTDLIENYNSILIQKSITQVTYNEYIELLPEKLKIE